MIWRKKIYKIDLPKFFFPAIMFKEDNKKRMIEISKACSRPKILKEIGLKTYSNPLSFFKKKYILYHKPTKKFPNPQLKIPKRHILAVDYLNLELRLIGVNTNQGWIGFKYPKKDQKIALKYIANIAKQKNSPLPLSVKKQIGIMKKNYRQVLITHNKKTKGL